MTQATQNYDYLTKVIILGDYGVGKSSLMLRFAEGTFTDMHIATIGVEFKARVLNVGETRVNLQMWDTGGGARFQEIIKTYYRGTKGFIVVYDIASRLSFEHVDKWIEDIDIYKTGKVFKILVGSKCDLESAREVSYEEGLQKAKLYGIQFFEASAKTPINVDSIFNLLAAETLQIVQEELLDAPAEAKDSMKIKKLDSNEGEIKKHASCF